MYFLSADRNRLGRHPVVSGGAAVGDEKTAAVIQEFGIESFADAALAVPRSTRSPDADDIASASTFAARNGQRRTAHVDRCRV